MHYQEHILYSQDLCFIKHQYVSQSKDKVGLMEGKVKLRQNSNKILNTLQLVNLSIAHVKLGGDSPSLE